MFTKVLLFKSGRCCHTSENYCQYCYYFTVSTGSLSSILASFLDGYQIDSDESCYLRTLG